MNNKTGLTGIFTLLIVATLSACGGGGGSDAPPASNPPSVPATTAVGVTDGSLNGSGATLTTAGGSISALDSAGNSKLTLTVPAGALAADTLINIFRITNTAHGGIGGSFRLEPDGQTFNSPVTLTFTYTDNDLADSDPEMLGAAFQTADGYWQWMGTPVIDTNAKTISLTTTHFTDFSMVKGFQIRPASKTINTNETAALRVVYCYEPSVGDDALQPLGYDCDGSDDNLAPLLPTADVSNWSVNGVTGGNSTVGTVSGSSTTATYHAPGSVPGSNPVAVSAQVTMSSGSATVVANITVTNTNSYSGNVTFNNNANGFNATNGTATVSWAQIEDTGDTRSYEATGTISADVGYDGCNSVPVTTALIPNSHLVIYTASNALAPNTYAFALAGTQFSVTLNCGGSSVPLTGVITVPVGTCGINFEPQPISDYTHLAGSYSCLTDYSHNNVTWDFNAL